MARQLCTECSGSGVVVDYTQSFALGAAIGIGFMYTNKVCPTCSGAGTIEQRSR